MKSKNGDLRNIVITGASDGIGLALTKIFAAQNNVDLVCTGSRPQEMLPIDFPKNAAYFQVDQRKQNCADLLFEQFESKGWKRIDKLFLVAGYGLAIGALDETPENIERTLQINLTAPMSIIHALTPLLLSQNVEEAGVLPTVCLIGSTAHKGAKGFASYAASKAGLEGFARALQSEWVDRANVQIIHPGPVATHMHAKAGLKLGLVRKFFADPHDMASAIAKLSDTAISKKTLSTGFAMRSKLVRLAGLN